jgi:predicted nucleotidyltransferase component of viral defense system
MRGGTLLHKVHLAPPARYSEDIDLVVFRKRPEDHIRKALMRVLLDVLGNQEPATEPATGAVKVHWSAKSFSRSGSSLETNDRCRNRKHMQLTWV